MFDFVIDVSNIVWGIVGSVEENEITVPDHEWAPGIWAGSEGCTLEIGRKVFTIIKVDLQNRTFTVCPHPDNSQLIGLEIRPRIKNGKL